MSTMKSKINFKEQIHTSAQLYPVKQLKSQQIFSPLQNQKEKCQNICKLIQFYQKGGILSKNIISTLISKGKNILKQQSNLLYLSDPINIIGDIHGQFFDLTTIITLLNLNNSQNTDQTTLFLGDYVDRGHFSTQVMSVLLLLKIYWPKKIYLLRGNHQSRNQTAVYNFRTQCIKKYNQQIYDLFMDIFDCLPLAAIVNNSILCVHAGVSTQLKSISDINKINRFEQIPISGMFCDLMWSDPSQKSDGQLPNNQISKFNTNRCCSINYGYRLLNQIYKRNHLICMIRAHQVQLEGYKFHHWHGKTALPTMITIFSAPEYCGAKNKGAFIKIKKNKIQILQQLRNNFQPYVLPNFFDAFQLSVPIMCAQVSRIFWFLLNQNPIRKNTEDDILNCSQLTSEGEQPLDKLTQRQIQKKRIFLYKQYSHYKSYIQQNISFVENDSLQQSLAKNKG